MAKDLKWWSTLQALPRPVKALLTCAAGIMAMVVLGRLDGSPQPEIQHKAMDGIAFADSGASGAATLQPPPTAAQLNAAFKEVERTATERISLAERGSMHARAAIIGGNPITAYAQLKQMRPIYFNVGDLPESALLAQDPDVMAIAEHMKSMASSWAYALTKGMEYLEDNKPSAGAAMLQGFDMGDKDAAQAKASLAALKARLGPPALALAPPAKHPAPRK